MAGDFHGREPDFGVGALYVVLESTRVVPGKHDMAPRGYLW